MYILNLNNKYVLPFSINEFSHIDHIYCSRFCDMRICELRNCSNSTILDYYNYYLSEKIKNIKNCV